MCRLKLYLSQKEPDKNLRTKRISTILVSDHQKWAVYKPSKMMGGNGIVLPTLPALQSQKIRHSTVTTSHFPRRPQGRPVEEIKVRSTRAGMFSIKMDMLSKSTGSTNKMAI